MFWTCSRIRSISAFTSTMACAMGVGALRAEGVRLARHLLQQEIEATSDCLRGSRRAASNCAQWLSRRVSSSAMSTRSAKRATPARGARRPPRRSAAIRSRSARSFRLSPVARRGPRGPAARRPASIRRTAPRRRTRSCPSADPLAVAHLVEELRTAASNAFRERRSQRLASRARPPGRRDPGSRRGATAARPPPARARRGAPSAGRRVAPGRDRASSAPSCIPSTRTAISNRPRVSFSRAI